MCSPGSIRYPCWMYHSLSTKLHGNLSSRCQDILLLCRIDISPFRASPLMWLNTRFPNSIPIKNHREQCYTCAESHCYCYLTWAGSLLSEKRLRSRENVGSLSGTSCSRNRRVISDRSSVPLKVRSRAATPSCADLREESCQSDSSSLTAEESSALSLSSGAPFWEEVKQVYLQSWWQRSSLKACAAL